MDQNNGTFRLIVGGIFVLAAAFFILNGGDYGGKKTIASDKDLPPIASTGR